jgi:hypothetical protein
MIQKTRNTVHSAASINVDKFIDELSNYQFF